MKKPIKYIDKFYNIEALKCKPLLHIKISARQKGKKTYEQNKKKLQKEM